MSRDARLGSCRGQRGETWHLADACTARITAPAGMPRPRGWWAAVHASGQCRDGQHRSVCQEKPPPPPHPTPTPPQPAQKRPACKLDRPPTHRLNPKCRTAPM